MIFLSRVFKRITWLMHMFSGAILVSMMFVTLADVCTRSIFEATDGDIDFTFIGGVELVKYGLLLTVFFTLPHSLERSQVSVDLFTENWSDRMKSNFEGFYLLGFMFLGACMCYQFFHSIFESKISGETTQDLLIPMYYLYSITSFAAAILALAALLGALNHFFGSDKGVAS